MDEDTLVAAMRPGSRSPLEERSPKDLGRFGMGLKTASFSQCRRLTVASKVKKGCVSVRCWDIDHVCLTDEWQLLKNVSSNTTNRLDLLHSMANGTIVLWEFPDRMIGTGNRTNNSGDQDRFHRIIDDVKEYLSMVFHVFLEGNNPSIRIYVNGDGPAHRVKPWNPFCENHSATTPFPEEGIVGKNGKITICGYVLPHKDKLTADEYIDFAGPGGWNARQGIYIYRNQRLLVAGGWAGLGIGKSWIQEEQYKLARIRVEITNAMDFDWLIDIKKASAKPPSWIRPRLTALSERVRKQAREVFVHRGTYNPRNPKAEINRLWMTSNNAAGISYKLDWNNYLIREIDDLLLTRENKQVFKVLLRTIEETVPIARIWLDTAEKPDNHLHPFESADEADLRQMILTSYRLLRRKGLTHSASIVDLKNQEAYQEFCDYIDTINEGE